MSNTPGPVDRSARDQSQIQDEEIQMKLLFLVASASLLSAPVLAAGCIKGAAVGGVAGHYVGKGHAFMGAAVGCAVGHHRAAVAAKRQAAAQQPAPAPQPKH